MNQWMIVFICLIAVVSNAVCAEGKSGESVEYSYEYYLDDDVPESFKSYLETSLKKVGSSEEPATKKHLQGEKSGSDGLQSDHLSNSDVPAPLDHHKKRHKARHGLSNKRHKKESHVRKTHHIHSNQTIHNITLQTSPNITEYHNDSFILDYLSNPGVPVEEPVVSDSDTLKPEFIKKEENAESNFSKYNINGNSLNSIDLNINEKTNDSLTDLSILNNSNGLQTFAIGDDKANKSEDDINVVGNITPLDQESTVSSSFKIHENHLLEHELTNPIPNNDEIPEISTTLEDENKGNISITDAIQPPVTGSAFLGVTERNIEPKTQSDVSLGEEAQVDSYSKYHHNITSTDLSYNHTLNKEVLANFLNSEKNDTAGGYDIQDGSHVRTLDTKENESPSKFSYSSAEKYITNLEHRNESETQNNDSLVNSVNSWAAEAAPYFMHRRASAMLGKKRKTSTINGLQVDPPPSSASRNDELTSVNHSDSNIHYKELSDHELTSTFASSPSYNKSGYSIEQETLKINDSNIFHRNYPSYTNELNTNVKNSIQNENTNLTSTLHLDDENKDKTLSALIYKVSNNDFSKVENSSLLNDAEKYDRLLSDEQLSMLHLNGTSKTERIKYLSNAINDYRRNNHSIIANGTNTTHPLEDMISHLLHVLSKKTLKKRKIKRKRSRKPKRIGLTKKSNFAKSKVKSTQISANDIANGHLKTINKSNHNRTIRQPPTKHTKEERKRRKVRRKMKTSRQKQKKNKNKKTKSRIDRNVAKTFTVGYNISKKAGLTDFNLNTAVPRITDFNSALLKSNHVDNSVIGDKHKDKELNLFKGSNSDLLSLNSTLQHLKVKEINESIPVLTNPNLEITLPQQNEIEEPNNEGLYTLAPKVYKSRSYLNEDLEKDTKPMTESRNNNNVSLSHAEETRTSPVNTRSYDNIEPINDSVNSISEHGESVSSTKRKKDIENSGMNSFERNINLDTPTWNSKTDESRFDVNIRNQGRSVDQTGSSSAISHLIDGINSLTSALSQRFIHHPNIGNTPILHIHPNKISSKKNARDHLPVIEQGSIYGNYIISSGYLPGYGFFNDLVKTPHYNPEINSVNYGNVNDMFQKEYVNPPKSGDFKPYWNTPPISRLSLNGPFWSTERQGVMTHQNHRQFERTHDTTFQPITPSYDKQYQISPPFPRYDPLHPGSFLESLSKISNTKTGMSVERQTKHIKHDYNSYDPSKPTLNKGNVQNINKIRPSDSRMFDRQMQYDIHSSHNDFNTGRYDHLGKTTIPFENAYDIKTTSSIKGVYPSQPYPFDKLTKRFGKSDNTVAHSSLDNFNRDKFSTLGKKTVSYGKTVTVSTNRIYDDHRQVNDNSILNQLRERQRILPLPKDLSQPPTLIDTHPNDYDRNRVGILVLDGRCFQIFINEKTLQLLTNHRNLPIDYNGLRSHHVQVLELFDPKESEYYLRTPSHHTALRIPLSYISNTEFEKMYYSLECPETTRKIIRCGDGVLVVECISDYNNEKIKHYETTHLTKGQSVSHSTLKSGSERSLPDGYKSEGQSKITISDPFNRDHNNKNQQELAGHKKKVSRSMYTFNDQKYIPNMTRNITKVNKTSESAYYIDDVERRDKPIEFRYSFIDNRDIGKFNEGSGVNYRSNNNVNTNFDNPAEIGTSITESKVPLDQKISDILGRSAHYPEINIDHSRLDNQPQDLFDQPLLPDDGKSNEGSMDYRSNNNANINFENPAEVLPGITEGKVPLDQKISDIFGSPTHYPENNIDHSKFDNQPQDVFSQPLPRSKQSKDDVSIFGPESDKLDPVESYFDMITVVPENNGIPQSKPGTEALEPKSTNNNEITNNAYSELPSYNDAREQSSFDGPGSEPSYNSGNEITSNQIPKHLIAINPNPFYDKKPFSEFPKYDDYLRQAGLTPLSNPSIRSDSVQYNGDLVDKIDNVFKSTTPPMNYVDDFLKFNDESIGKNYIQYPNQVYPSEPERPKSRGTGRKHYYGPTEQNFKGDEIVPRAVYQVRDTNSEITTRKRTANNPGNQGYGEFSKAPRYFEQFNPQLYPRPSDSAGYYDF